MVCQVHFPPASADVRRLSASAVAIGWRRLAIDREMLADWQSDGKHVTDRYALDRYPSWRREPSIHLHAVAYLELPRGLTAPLWRLEVRDCHGPLSAENAELSLPLWPAGADPFPLPRWLPHGVLVWEEA